MEKLKELITYPSSYTFKIIGENSEMFKKNIEEIFSSKDKSVELKESNEKKYMSITLTTIVEDYDELKEFYCKIAMLKEVKFCA